jgi:NADPH:quinone reductase-like Zn-dependent oxidoreductase
MRSYHVNSGAGLAGLTLQEHDEPRPGPREVLVRMRAVSLNFRDLMILRGIYPLPVKPDVVAVSDGAGEVAAVGEGVMRAEVGDRVMAAMFPRWMDGPFAWEYAQQIGGSLDGMLTEFAVLSEEALVSIPTHLSFEEAATLPCAAVTAWHALTVGRRRQPGENVLTLGSGCVSLFALQFAKLFGARVIAPTSSDTKAERLKSLGANDVVNYKTTPEWHFVVRQLTGGRGVDRVVEVGGGTLEKSIQATAVEGQIGFVGRLDNASTIDINILFNSIATLRVVAAGSRAHFVAMNRAIAEHRLRPVIDRVFPFTDVLAAFRYYERGGAFGKVVISVG